MALDDNRTVTARLDEAFLVLLKDLAEILATDWEEKHPVPVEHIKRQIAEAVRNALEIRI